MLRWRREAATDGRSPRRTPPVTRWVTPSPFRGWKTSLESQMLALQRS